ncbi:NAD(P)-dependent dehydrogenase, short-chain alcohol dehydrogenase family [Solimonas aquatica]|uniref:NAD(P)-dependent dehydrogenase, short-chain alcohol dehydrogenase family n=1 Tax=Solimonas aquatica TaxID=489703 RepID=A0A1H9G348_9GAMM|nr:SDR family oxidoreductase [Solimonas aquatica]SEQ44393.1 NAD(P)-dependent dehydrogenase, short-chain alcohol dehydrogenase family [Solimonas aquatica]
MATQNEKPVVLITGASAGIGDAIARRFAREGWRIVAVARRRERLERLAQDLAGVSEVEIVSADVSARGAGDAAVAAALKRFGRLDCLVNNAGSFKFGAVDQVDDDMLDEAIELSLKAPFRFCRAAVRVMQPGSSIINMGSVWGILAGMGGGSYCAVKAGLIGLTQSIAADYGARGIRANLIAPGVVKTEMTDAFWDSDGFKRTNHELTPFNRECTVADVANAVYFLASEQGSYINGQTLALDGGWSKTKYLAVEAITAQRVQA